MKPESENLLLVTKTKGQKEFLIKLVLATFVLFVVFLAIFFEFQFRRPLTLEGLIQSCQYQGYAVDCSYLQTLSGNFLLTSGTLDKARQTLPLSKIYQRKVRLTGYLSKQKVAVKNLGKLRRFQIEKLEFLD